MFNRVYIFRPSPLVIFRSDEAPQVSQEVCPYHQSFFFAESENE